jgi:hypothetical protein
VIHFKRKDQHPNFEKKKRSKERTRYPIRLEADHAEWLFAQRGTGSKDLDLEF